VTQGSYRDLSVDAVMAEAGLARTLFYRHFDGLPALILSLLEDLGAGLTGSGDPADPEFLRRVLERTVDVVRRHGPLLRAIDDAARHDAEVERAYRSFLDWSIDTTAAILAEGIASGRVRDVPDIRATAQALNLMNGVFLIDTLGPRRAGPSDGRARGAVDDLGANARSRLVVEPSERVCWGSTDTPARSVRQP
jgi:TetR/AcrR family transcriptional regulator, ethionamide resistance regulator